ncbi:MAG: hypothetical protein PSN34_08880 [Urechidicola sp.]|nr:hypothetical protein [Urechidicola sp.]
MKKLLLLLLIVLYACNRTKNDLSIKGYYYKKNSPILYSFNNDSVIIYNIKDSIIDSQSLNIIENKLILNNKSYNFKIYKNDSLEFGNSKEKFTLISFDYIDFGMQNIFNTNWHSNDKKQKAEFILKIKEDNVQSYYKLPEEISARFNSTYKFEGKYFGKFNFHSSNLNMIFTSYTGKSLSGLLISEFDVIDDFTFSKYFYDKSNSELLGGWYKTKDTPYHIERMTKEYLNIHNLKQTDASSIIGHHKIEFTEDSLICYIGEEKYIKKVTHKIDYSIPGYILFNNSILENQYMKVLDISNDSLKLEIYNSKLIFNYVKR